MNTPNSRAKKGFTLIELLVIIAIIAILASILLPVLARAKLRANSLSCRNNLRQLSTAFVMYRNDNRGQMIGKTSANGSGYEWVYTLQPYYGNNNATNQVAVIMCPSVTPYPNPNGVGNPNGTASQPWVDSSGSINVTESAYTLNGWLYDTTDSYSMKVPTCRFNKEANVNFTATTPVFGDGIWIDTWPMTSDTLTSYAPLNLFTGNNNNNATGGGGMGRFLISRHSGTSPIKAPQNVPAGTIKLGTVNLAFFDGHVESVPIVGLYQYTWNMLWTGPISAW